MKNREIFGAVSPSTGQAEYIVKAVKKTGLTEAGNSLVISPDCRLAVSFPDMSGQRISDSDSYMEFTNGWVKIYGSFVTMSGIDIRQAAQRLTLPPDKIHSDIYSDIDGHYVILAFNKAANVFSIITDRLGMLHLYYRYNKDGTVFFSTSSRLLASLICFPGLDHRACLEFAATGMMFEKRTFYKGIKKFGSGTINSIDLNFLDGNNSFSTRKIWAYGKNMGEPVNSMGEAKNLLAKSLVATLKGVTDKYPHPVCDLTGGFDSRMVMAGLLASTGCFDTITAGKKSRDAEIAAKIAAAFGLNHNCIDSEELYSETDFIDDMLTCLRISDGELGIVETFGPFLIQKNNSLGYQASINGSGGELCRGRWWEGEGYNAGKKYSINSEKLKKRLFPYGCDWFPFIRDCKIKCNEYIDEYIIRKTSFLTDELNTRKIDFIYTDVRLGRWAGRHLSNTIKLLPVIAPLIMGNLPELSFRIHPLIKKGNKVVREAFEHLNPRLAAIPMCDGSPAFPLRINNISCFFPFFLTKARYYAQKIREKLISQNEIGAYAPSKESKILITLDKHGIIAGILDFCNMKTAFLYDKKHFDNFIETCRRNLFQNHPHQLSRMLTLEWTIRECSSNMTAIAVENVHAEITG